MAVNARGRPSRTSTNCAGLSDDTRAFLNGARKAVALVKRLEDDEDLADAASIEPEYRDGASQRNVVWELLEPLAAAGDLHGLRGCCAVLSGYLGATTACCVPDAAYLGSYVAHAAARADSAFMELVRRLEARS